MYIEAAVMPGKGDIQLTGQLGDVIKASALIRWLGAGARARGAVAQDAPRGWRRRRPGGALASARYASRARAAAGACAGGIVRARGSVRSVSPTESSAAAASVSIVANGIDSLALASGPLGARVCSAGGARASTAPQGAIDEDGPSAGVAMCSALVSLFSGRPVRSDVARPARCRCAGWCFRWVA